MDIFCFIVAAGSEEFVHLVLDFINPSIDNLPPFAVALVVYHLASDAMIKGALAGNQNLSERLILDIMKTKD